MTVWSGFPRYTLFDPKVPVYHVVKSGRPTIHRFFDTSPLSPSGRFIGLTEFPYEDRLPSPGDEAAVVVVDLHSGDEVYRSSTAAWDTQVGAQVQWGRDDSQLFFNRMNTSTWEPYGVVVDITDGREMRLGSTVYVVSNCGRYVLTPSLRKIAIVQAGYGVCVPSRLVEVNRGAPPDDGVFLSDCLTGESRLLVSMSDIYFALAARFRDLDLRKGGFYGFHVKWNRRDDRIMFIMRWMSAESKNGKAKNYLVTFKPDGSDIRMALDAKRWGGGHHPNWCPDGERIVMNLVFTDRNRWFPDVSRFLERVAKKLRVRYFSDAHLMRFAIFGFDGSAMTVAAPSQYGSGHPTMVDGGRYLLTDCYPYERVAYSDGTVPLRLIDIRNDRVEEVIRIATKPIFEGGKREYRVDPHPAWDLSGRWLTFNGARNGSRTVYVADFAAYRPSFVGSGVESGAQAEVAHDAVHVAALGE